MTFEADVIPRRAGGGGGGGGGIMPKVMHTISLTTSVGCGSTLITQEKCNAGGNDNGGIKKPELLPSDSNPAASEDQGIADMTLVCKIF